MKRKLLSVFLTLTLIIGAAAASTVVSEAFWWDSSSDYTGKECTSNTTAASTIDYLMNKYKDGSTWKLSGECWGFAEKANSLLASSNSIKYYDGLKNTRSNFKKKCQGVMAGTHLRLSREKKFNGWYGHSVVILKATEDKAYWADNNYAGPNTVCYYSGTLDDLYDMYSQYGYINMVKKPTKYKSYSTPQISSKVDYDKGAIKLTWLRTTSTSKYQVYRSYSKNGTYKRIATTTAKNYLDKKVELGKTAYYKVKSVKSKGSVYSGYVSGKLKLAAPVISLIQNENGDVTVSWEAVPRADKYQVYCSVNEGTFKRKSTTTSLSYTADIGQEDGNYRFKVKAIYEKNSDGNSSYSNVEYINIAYIPAPTGLTGTTDADNYAILRWNPVQGADEYEIYCCDEPDGEYWFVDYAEDTTFIDDYRYYGDKYYYKVAAVNWDTGAVSAPSNWVWL